MKPTIEIVPLNPPPRRRDVVSGTCVVWATSPWRAITNAEINASKGVDDIGFRPVRVVETEPQRWVVMFTFDRGRS